MIHTIDDVDFFAGGRSHFTVTNGLQHYTYKIVKFGDTPFFVYYKTGPRQRDWCYLGCYIPSQFNLKLTRKSRLKYDSKVIKVFVWAINAVRTHLELPEGYEIMHVGRCCACARKLTNPKSIKDGIGPICLQEREKSYERRRQLGV